MILQISPAELQAGDRWNERLITAVGIIGDFVYIDFYSGPSATFTTNGTILVERKIERIES